MLYGIVYELFCVKSALKYVGQTTDTLVGRWKGHCDAALKTTLDWEIYKAIREHGIDSFQLCVLCECESKQELDIAERAFIAEFRTVWPNGYNMTNGGEGPCELTRKKISKRTKEAMDKLDPEWKVRQREAMADPEVRKRISERTKVAMQRSEVQVLMHASRDNHRTGYKTPKETIQKMVNTRRENKLKKLLEEQNRNSELFNTGER